MRLRKHQHHIHRLTRKVHAAKPHFRPVAGAAKRALLEIGEGFDAGIGHQHKGKAKSASNGMSHKKHHATGLHPPHSVAGHIGFLLAIKKKQSRPLQLTGPQPSQPMKPFLKGIVPPKSLTNRKDPNFELKHPRDPQGSKFGGHFRRK